MAVGNIRSRAFQWAAFHAALAGVAVLFLALDFDLAFFVDELRAVAGYFRP